MTQERLVALRILNSAVDAMGYWEENKYLYTDGDISDEEVEAINSEILKIVIQITKRYGLQRKLY